MRHDHRRDRKAQFFSTRSDLDKADKRPVPTLTRSLAGGFVAKLLYGGRTWKGGERYMAKLTTKRRPEYAEEIEKTIYDSSSEFGLQGKSLMGIISIDGDYDQRLSIPRGLIRCVDSMFAKVIDRTFLVGVLCCMIVTPLSFVWNGEWSDPQYVPGGRALLVFDILLDMLTAGYLILQLNTSFLHKTRRVEVISRNKILKFRLYSLWWWSQLIGAMSYVWIAGADAPLLFNFVKIVRMIHLVKLPDSFWHLSGSEKLRPLGPPLILVVMAHWVACLISCLGGYSEQLKELGSDTFETTISASWTGESAVSSRVVSGYISVYFMAFVEALYMLTGALDNPLGADGARHKNFGSLIIVSVFGPVGCVVVAFFIASIVRVHEEGAALEIRHEENRELIKCALGNLNIPQELQRRVFSMHYFQKMAHDNEALSQLFNRKNLSMPLESAIRVYLYMDSMLCSEYFLKKDVNYILEVIRLLEDHTFLPGDYVTRRGEVGDTMFFVAHGELEVLVPDPKSGKPLTVATKTVGDFFGEIAMVQDVVRTASVRANTYVLLSSLSRDDMEAIWHYWPQERRLLQTHIRDEAMREENRARAAVQQWAKKRIAKKKTEGKGKDKWASARQKALKTASSKLKFTIEQARVQAGKDRPTGTGHQESETDSDSDFEIASWAPQASDEPNVQHSASQASTGRRVLMQSLDSIALPHLQLDETPFEKVLTDSVLLETADSVALPTPDRGPSSPTKGRGTGPWGDSDPCACGAPLLEGFQELQSRVTEALKRQATLEGAMVAALDQILSGSASGNVAATGNQVAAGKEAATNEPNAIKEPVAAASKRSGIATRRSTRKKVRRLPRRGSTGSCPGAPSSTQPSETAAIGASLLENEVAETDGITEPGTGATDDRSPTRTPVSFKPQLRLGETLVLEPLSPREERGSTGTTLDTLPWMSASPLEPIESASMELLPQAERPSPVAGAVHDRHFQGNTPVCRSGTTNSLGSLFDS